MDKRDRYDELDNLISTLDRLISEITSKDIIDDLEYIKYNYIGEKDELEQEILDEEDAEERERDRQDYNSRI